jgi:antitoxin VapB
MAGECQIVVVGQVRKMGDGMATAKLFWVDGSQAVHLPKAYRFEGDEVRIRRHGDAVILEPVARDSPWLDRVTGPVDADFEAAALDRPSGGR